MVEPDGPHTDNILWRKKIHILFWITEATHTCAGDNIEKNEMGWACGAYG